VFAVTEKARQWWEWAMHARSVQTCPRCGGRLAHPLGVAADSATEPGKAVCWPCRMAEGVPLPGNVGRL